MTIETIAATLAGQQGLSGALFAWRRSADRTLCVAPLGPARRGGAVPPAPLRWPNHAPGARLDYTLDVSAVLQPGEAVTGAELDAAGIVLESVVVTSRAVTAWLSGGTQGVEASVSAMVSTNAGRIASHVVRLYCTAPP